MSSFDYFILVILALSGLVGLMRGLIKELMSLVAYVAAFVMALWWGPTVAGWLTSLMENSLLRSLAAYGLTFVAGLLGVGVINRLLAVLIEHTGLSSADRSLGMLFGVLRGVVLVGVMVVAAGYTQLPTEPWWQESSLVKTAIDALIGIKSHLPPNVADWLPY